MLTKRENFLQTIKKGGKPDRLVDDYTPFVPIMVDPVQRYTRGNRVKGKTTKDRWGTEIAWPEDQVFAMPHVTKENQVIKDITHWRDYVTVPDLVANCTDWTDALEKKASIDANEQLSLSFMGTGCFEQMHMLMAFDECLINLVLHKKEMDELAEAIGEFRFTYIKLIVDNLKPDAIISHDDWGSKNNLFMKPELWRRYFKPYYKKMYEYAKANGIIVIHHADSFCEPIVEDMVDCGVDVWQGVLPSNDILRLQKELDGRMALMGGVDSFIDRADSTEEEIRAEVRRVCSTYGPGGNFIPSITYGLAGSIYPHVDPILHDEIGRYNQEVYGVRD